MQDLPTLMWAIMLVVWGHQYHQGNVLRCTFPMVIYVVCTVVHIKHSFVLHVYTILYSEANITSTDTEVALSSDI